MGMKNELMQKLDDGYKRFSKGQKKLADFIREIGLPTDLRELGVDENTDLRAIADSSAMVSGSCTRLTQEEILRIFQECYGEDC